MDTQKQQIVESLKQANNILVTVSNNPSVDQLAACIGLTLALNKMKKHATAVFSGAVPPIIAFLEPEKTIERNTDSLRDFIIAIDKAKADKLRYKVEDKFVKIFITPYRTSISDKDLQFSEGDFNVDVVLALGVHKQTDLDQAITAHGRILHDATVISVNNQPNIELGSINLLETQASSLSEIAVELIDLLDKSMIDNQIATTLLTGIVAETDRFRNAKTTPATMSVSAELLTAGANQQLVASKLEPARPTSPAQVAPQTNNAPQTQSAEQSDNGTLQISHDENANGQPKPIPPAATPNGNSTDNAQTPQIHIDDSGQVHRLGDQDSPASGPAAPSPSLLPPLPPAQPMTPPQTSTLPPLPTPQSGPSPLNPFAASAPSPLNPFAQSQSFPADGVGLPPLPTSGGGHNPATQAPLDNPVMPPVQPMTPPQTSTLPPLPTAAQSGPSPLNPFAAPAPSPLNPFASPVSTQPAQPPSPRQQVEPSVVEPAIIQPDPNAVMAAQIPEQQAPLPPPVDLPPTIHTEGPHLMMQPPTFGNQSNSGMMQQDEDEDSPSGAAMPSPSQGSSVPLLQREPLQQQPVPASSPFPNPMGPSAPSMSLPPPPPPKVEPSPATPATGGDSTEPPVLAEESLTSLERDVKSPHLEYIESPVPNLPTSQSQTSSDQSGALSLPPAPTGGVAPQAALAQETDVESARDAVNAALQGTGTTEKPPLEPVTSLNAQPLGAPLHEVDDENAPPPGFSNDPNNGITPPPPVPPPLIPPTPS